jgi:HlyD family secretion protein
MSEKKTAANADWQPEHLDRMMTVVHVKSWIAMATVGIVLLALVIWGFGGTMQVRQDASGALVRSGKVIDIFAENDSVILDLAVARGDMVEQDQVLARIDQPELVSQINLLLTQGGSPEEIELLRQELLQRSQILTTRAGLVYDVYVKAGNYVQKGEKIATIQVDAGKDKSLECLLFVPVGNMKDIDVGQQVSVYPAGASKKTYGNMSGQVSFISEYPVTYQYLYEMLGSEDLAASFLATSACYEVALTLDVSEETPTGFEWTTSMGPSKPFGNMTLCDASIIVDELRPIDEFFADD